MSGLTPAESQRLLKQQNPRQTHAIVAQASINEANLTKQTVSFGQGKDTVYTMNPNERSYSPFSRHMQNQ